MHPGENLRVPSINNDIGVDDHDSSKWQTVPLTNNNTNSLKGSKSPSSKNNNGISVILFNGNNNKNGGSSFNNGTSDKNSEHNSKWPPLLSEMKPVNNLKKNNNEWSLMSDEKTGNGNGGGGASEKYTSYWPSNCDDTNGKLCGNNNGSLINNKTLLGNTNGYPAELESLTGKRKKHIEDDEDMVSDDISQCGLGGCQPRWTRSFASTHCFMVVFLIAWVLQGMYCTYFVSMITTIEKLFQIKSKTTGLLMSVVEIGQISTSLFLTYYAGRGHRPRWIACGMVLFAIASFGCTLPHFMFGDKLLEAHLKVSGHKSSSELGNLTQTEHSLKNILATAQSNLCYLNTTDASQTSSFFGQNLHTETECDSDNVRLEQDNQTDITSIVLAIFTVCLLIIGIGQTAVSTLGIPYIDDNVASRESPIYIAITIGVRILGPAAGFILGSICTRIPYPNLDPGIEPTDTQWVGAWYLGLLLVSSCMAFTSLAMFMFPRNLRGNRIPPPEKVRAIEPEKKVEVHHEEATPKFKDFPKTIKRQLSNDILMFRTASSVLHLLPVAGLYTFLPKYMETQFNLAAHDANLISGIGGILVMGVGIVISGIIILKFSPTAKSVAAWIAFTAIVYSIGMGLLMFIGCPMSNLVGYEQIKAFPDTPSGSLCLSNSSIECSCSAKSFSPICGANGVTYFSSCHAGCSNVTATEDLFSTGNKLLYSNCSCLEDESYTIAVEGLKYGQAKSGLCDGHCQKFVIFILLFSFFVFMHSTGEVGSMLLIMRCTDPKDKAMAMGVIQFAIGLFGNVPCPIIYGAIIDSACLVWESVCDKIGACSLYDGDTFRTFFFGATSGIMFLAFIMDLVVWRKADRIDIDPENASTSETEYEKAATNAPESTV